MATLSDDLSGTRPTDAQSSPVDDPANIDATQPIDIPTLLADWDRQS